MSIYDWIRIVKQAFSGIKVLAVARIIAAPFAAYQMAMHGADVVTIEDPADGDSARKIRDVGTEFRRLNMSRFFLACNANKRSITLNIKAAEGQEVFRKLAKNADVVIENLKAGTMARYGLGYEALCASNPGLIYAAVTGYGQTGPRSKDPGIDSAIQAGSGLMSLTGTIQSGPLRTGSHVVDYSTGYVAALAIASALFQREHTGVGQAIDVSMLETAMTLMSGDVVCALTGAPQPPLAGNGSASWLSNTFSCKSGVLAIAAPTPLRRSRLWPLIGRPDIALDPRFAEGAPPPNIPALEAEVSKALATKTAEEWERILNEGGVPAMRVVDLADAVRQEQLKQRAFFQHFDDGAQPGLPAFAVPTAAFRMSASETRIDSPPPVLGQHTDEILREAGFGPAEIEDLRLRRVI